MSDCVICGSEHQDVDESCERAAYRRNQSLIAENEKRRAEGAREEREAVVRWLREEWAPHFPNGSQARSEILGGAELIEAGEHWKP